MVQKHLLTGRIIVVYYQLMDPAPLLHLNLHTPLEYTEVPGLLFGSEFPGNEAAGELLFCFELDQEQAVRIDPDESFLPGNLVCAGRNTQTGNKGQKIQLPAGRYIFVQQRRALSQDECSYLAIEQQKDGLWERYKLDNRLYIRLLFEDGSTVTQLFRPSI